MKNKLEISVILRYLKIAFFTMLVLFTVIVLIYQLHYVFCSSQNSFFELIANKHFLKFLFIACFGVLTLYIAGKQLKKQSDIACMTALIELRKLLTSENNRKVHLIFANKNEQKTLLGEKLEGLKDEGLTTDENGRIISNNMSMLDYYNYLGTIGLGVFMVKRKLIDWDTFYSNFGYRVENIFDTEKNDIHIKIRKHINDNKSYYKNLLWVKEEILKRNIE